MISRILVSVLLVASAMAQETCKSCPTPAEMNLQFPQDENSTHEYKIFTKKYVGIEFIHFSAMLADNAITLKFEGKHCYEGNNGFPEIVSGKELALEDAAEMGIDLFIRTIVIKSHPPKWASLISYIGPVRGIENHVHGGEEWYYRCR